MSDQAMPSSTPLRLSTEEPSASKTPSMSTPETLATETPAKDCAWPLPITPRNTIGRDGHNAVRKGQVFARLQVLSDTPAKTVGGRRHWECMCVCGTVAIVAGAHLNNGNTRSCGCLCKEMTKKTVTKHGKSKDRAYTSWAGMLYRCGNDSCTKYYRYGGRGISVCDRWYKFENFYADMGDPPPGLSIDRIDNDLGYYPENCRWATQETQTQDSSRSKISWEAVKHTSEGRDLSTILAEKYGVSRQLVTMVRRNKIWYDPLYEPKGKQNGNTPGT